MVRTVSDPVGPSVDREAWTLEMLLALLVGLPWWWFSRSIIASAIIHLGLATLFLGVEAIFGRGSAIMSFLLVLVFSVLVGLIAVGAYGGRLFS